MFILLASYNEYDQHGSYFITSWSKRPTLKQVQKASSKYGVKFTNGRESSEDLWLDLVNLKEGKVLNEDEDIDMYRVAAIGEKAILNKKNEVLLRGETSISPMEYSYMKTNFPEILRVNSKNKIDVRSANKLYNNFLIDNKYLDEFKKMFKIFSSNPRGWRLKPNYFMYKQQDT